MAITIAKQFGIKVSLLVSPGQSVFPQSNPYAPVNSSIQLLLSNLLLVFLIQVEFYVGLIFFMFIILLKLCILNFSIFPNILTFDLQGDLPPFPPNGCWVLSAYLSGAPDHSEATCICFGCMTARIYIIIVFMLSWVYLWGGGGEFGGYSSPHMYLVKWEKLPLNSV